MTTVIAASTGDSAATVATSEPATEVDANTEGATGQEGQAGASAEDDSATTATKAAAEDVFFDPKDLPAELQPQWKRMQASFTKKMQSISQHRGKIDAYDAFERDPVGTMQQIAGRMGFQLTRAEAAAAAAKAAQAGEASTDWQPQNWQEVIDKIGGQIMEKVQQSLAPVFQGVQKATAHNIEKELDAVDANWRMYEDEMRTALRDHPSLVNDVSKLYRLSVPEEVLSSRAVQAALKKLEDKGKAASVHGGSTTQRTQSAIKPANSFEEAVEQAREKGKKAGWYK
ncbi:MAG: hypothetical protein QMD11_02730 [Smithella sp.]|nr:hypothetical protein [Smithella sp.]